MNPTSTYAFLQTLKSLGYNYDVSSPIVSAATGEFCEEFMKYVRIDADTEETLKALAWKIQVRDHIKLRYSRMRA